MKFEQNSEPRAAQSTNPLVESSPFDTLSNIQSMLVIIKRFARVMLNAVEQHNSPDTDLYLLLLETIYEAIGFELDRVKDGLL